MSCQGKGRKKNSSKYIWSNGQRDRETTGWLNCDKWGWFVCFWILFLCVSSSLSNSFCVIQTFCAVWHCCLCASSKDWGQWRWSEESSFLFKQLLLMLLQTSLLVPMPRPALQLSRITVYLLLCMTGHANPADFPLRQYLSHTFHLPPGPYSCHPKPCSTAPTTALPPSSYLRHRAKWTNQASRIL